MNGASLALHVVHGVATSMTPSGAGLDAVWGNSDSDVWAAGAGVLVHWDGTAWTDLAEASVATADCTFHQFGGRSSYLFRQCSQKCTRPLILSPVACLFRSLTPSHTTHRGAVDVPV